MATAARVLTPGEASAHPPLEAVVVRFAGDSGDGMQLTGGHGVAQMLIDFGPGLGTPVALGVIYDHPRPTFDRVLTEQNQAAAAGKTANLQALISRGQTWQVDKEPHVV